MFKNIFSSSIVSEIGLKSCSCNKTCCFNKQKTIKPEKEGEEKVKKPRFPNILGPPRRLSRVDSTSGLEKNYFSNKHLFVDAASVSVSLCVVSMCLRAVGKAVELNKQRSPKQLSQPGFAIPEQSDSAAPNSGRSRGNPLSEGSDNQSAASTTSPAHSPPTGPASDTSGQDSDSSERNQTLF